MLVVTQWRQTQSKMSKEILSSASNLKAAICIHFVGGYVGGESSKGVGVVPQRGKVMYEIYIYSCLLSWWAGKGGRGVFHSEERPKMSREILIFPSYFWWVGRGVGLVVYCHSEERANGQDGEGKRRRGGPVCN